MCHMPEINKWENDKSQIDSSRKSLQQPSKVTPNFVVNIFCHCDSIIDFLANCYFILQIYHDKSFKMRYFMSRLIWGIKTFSKKCTL